MPIALVAHTTMVPAGANGGTSGTAIDTSGANGLMVMVGAYQGSGSISLGSVTDNKSNSFVRRGFLKTSTVGYQIELWDSIGSPTVGTGHTFTQTSSNSFNCFCVAAYSGIGSYGGLVDAQIPSGSTTGQGGSLTPGFNGSLLLSGLLFNDNMTSGTAAIDSGYSITDQILKNSNQEGVALAYLIQSLAGAVNPTWSSFNSGAWETAILNAYYLPTGVGSSAPSLTTLGVGLGAAMLLPGAPSLDRRKLITGSAALAAAETLGL